MPKTTQQGQGEKMSKEKLSVPFEKWLNELNAAAYCAGFKGWRTFWQSTGADAWRGYFDDGLTAEQALREDCAHV